MPTPVTFEEEKMKPTSVRCCPDKDVVICRGCGYDHGRQYLIDLIAEAKEQGAKEESERVEKIIRSLSDETIYGELKYWTKKAFEEYFEDKGYKFGPQRFLDLLKG